MTTVLDSSALLALLWQENGHEAVGAVLGDCVISSVNMAEVYSKFADRGIDSEAARQLLEEANIRTAPFDSHQSFLVGELRSRTRQYGLSLGDRACLALALNEAADVLTADRVWLELDLGIDIRSIR